MRLKRYLALLGLCAVAPGCAPLKQVAQVTICQPIAYCMHMDEYVSLCRDRELADEAWAHFQSAIPDCQYSEDFADGFKTGFADYVFAGGNGEPPVVPPRYFWRPSYESPVGQQMMLDWFRGYRHGVAVAKESGYREAVVIPASDMLQPSYQPIATTHARPVPMPGADELVPEQLPPPKDFPGPKELPRKQAPMSSNAPRTSSPYAVVPKSVQPVPPPAPVNAPPSPGSVTPSPVSVSTGASLPAPAPAAVEGLPSLPRPASSPVPPPPMPTGTTGLPALPDATH
jgi:hypothetical protein